MLTANLPFAPLLMAYLQSASRLEVEFIAQVAVDALDRRDGDPDIELNGDETDHDGAEDSFSIDPKGQASGPGCIYSDPDYGVDDKGEEIGAEDSFQYFAADGPGCPIADPDANRGTEC